MLRIFLLSTALLFSCQAYSQSERMLSLSTAWPVINERLPEGSNYLPFHLILTRNLTNLFKEKKSDLFVIVEPHLVWALSSPSGQKNWEAGVNLGLEYQLPLSASNTLLAAVASGPHYISLETAMQAGGFIFSDNFTAGIRHKLQDSGISLDMKFRFRHISNANLQKPNKGIDNWFIITGITKNL